MKSKPILMRTVRHVVARAVLARSASTSAVALAQTAPPAAPAAPSGAERPMPPHGMPGMEGRHGMHGMHGMRMAQELERFKTSLRLDANQSALWDRAVAQMKPPADMREKMKARHEQLAAMLDDPKFDPRKLAADMDAMRAERMARRKAIRDQWFAVYDSLNPVQRGQAREFLRSRMARPWMHRGPMGDRPPGASEAPRG